MSDAHLTDVSFTNLHLPDTLARGIADAGFERCTPIQAQTLPRALAGMDVAGQAQTGTGKTAAFLVAMYAALLRREVPPTRRSNAPRALIIAPTRELAVQIRRDAEILGQYTGLILGLAFGGVDYEKQRRELEARGYLVTPGFIDLHAHANDEAGNACARAILEPLLRRTPPPPAAPGLRLSHR